MRTQIKFIRDAVGRGHLFVWLFQPPLRLGAKKISDLNQIKTFLVDDLFIIMSKKYHLWLVFFGEISQ
jgi:hypothetical protein